MESVDGALKQMGENVSGLQAVKVPGLAKWGQDKLTECRGRWESLSKQVRQQSSQRRNQIIERKKKQYTSQHMAQNHFVIGRWSGFF